MHHNPSTAYSGVNVSGKGIICRQLLQAYESPAFIRINLFVSGHLVGGCKLRTTGTQMDRLRGNESLLDREVSAIGCKAWIGEWQ